MSGAHLAARPLRRHAHWPPGPSQRRCWPGLGCWSAHLPPGAHWASMCYVGTRSRKVQQSLASTSLEEARPGGPGAGARLEVGGGSFSGTATHPPALPRSNGRTSKTRAGKSIQRSKRAADQAQHRCDVVQRNAVGAMGTVGGLHPARVPADGAGVQGSGGGGGGQGDPPVPHTRGTRPQAPRGICPWPLSAKGPSVHWRGGNPGRRAASETVP